MIDWISLVAVLSASLFAGAALYINVAEHPARLKLATPHAVAHWAPSYQRATLMQAPLALVSAVAGATMWLLGAGWCWLAAALLIGLVVPFTLVVIMRTNRQLLAPDLDRNSELAARLLRRWGQLHAVRTVLSLLAAFVYTWLLLQR